ncbi:MAG: hypothetical protein GY852_06275, partial [bacterium]|nr:hypothetical protein [bacterium]
MATQFEIIGLPGTDGTDQAGKNDYSDMPGAKDAVCNWDGDDAAKSGTAGANGASGYPGNAGGDAPHCGDVIFEIGEVVGDIEVIVHGGKGGKGGKGGRAQNGQNG